MTRRLLLSLIELTLFTAALATSLGLLAHAASVGHAQWADPAMAGVVTALSLLVPTTLAALLRAAWLGTPPLLRAVRGRVHDWRQWRGIQRVDAAPVRPVRDTMAVRPRVAHAAPPAHDGLTQTMPVVEAGPWRPRGRKWAVNTFKSIELCAGAGGQALGIERAGFGHEALVENDADACRTLRKNRPWWNVVETDVRGFEWTGGHVDLLAAGVPCPPFSIAGQQLGADDDRDLFPALLRLVGEIRPSAVMVENVKGLLQARFAGYRGQILQQLKELGYVPVMWDQLNACDYGVPQLRPRSVLVALLPEFADAWVPPQPRGLCLTVGEALAQSMHDRGLHDADLAAWATKAWSVAPTLVGGSKKHGGPDLGPTRAREKWQRLGVDARSVADDKEPATLDGPKGLGPRLTVEQCAIIQGFPPEWQFAGKKTARYRQVGNAFPAPVAQAVAERIAAALEGGH